MGGIAVVIRNWWERADKTQRFVTLGGGGLFLVLLVATFLFASRPQYEPLVYGLSDQDTNEVVKTLDAAGIPEQHLVAGEVDVPSNKLQDAKLKVAESGKLSSNAHLGIEGLDHMNLMTTPAQERARLESIAEGELARTIESMDGVQSATVKIAPGDDSLIADQRRPTTAGVTISEKVPGSITADQAHAIASLISRSVEGLSIDNVNVINDHMETLFDGQDATGAGSQSTRRLDLEKAYNRDRRREIQTMLDQIYGPGATVVSVKAVFDLDSQSTVSKTQRPTADPILSQKTTEKMNGGTGRPGGLAGAAGNLAATAPATKDGDTSKSDSAYANTTEAVQRGLDEIDTTTEKVPGTVKSLVVNVAADSNRIKDAAAQAQLTKWVEDEANKTGDPQQNVANVTFTAFDTSALAEAAKAQTAAASESRTQQIIGLLPLIAVVVIAAMVLRQTGSFARLHAPAMVLQESPYMTLPSGGLGGPGSPSASELLAALEHSLPDVPHDSGMRGSVAEEEEINVDSIKNKVHVPLEQLKKMAHERPGVFSMLVKSLLLEDNR